jgi:quercetin dioxygenase-like cupin family protein
MAHEQASQGSVADVDISQGEIMPTAPRSEILKLTVLADYQAGAIVSRQVVKTEGGNVTFFAFDQGQELSEHTAPFDALVHVLDGRVEVRLSGKPHLLAAGEAILMPANEPHALRAVERFKMLLTMLKD